VFLARHGQTEWNAQRLRQGQLDSPLTSDGVMQAQSFAALLRNQAIDAVFSSPLGRARSTAHIIAGHIRVPLVVIDELAEVHHGQFAGLSNEEINTRYPGELDRRARDMYHWAFPGGESYADADLRARRALALIAAHQAGRPLIVSHEMIGKMLQRHLLRLTPDEALTIKHPNDVVYAIDPHTGTRHELRKAEGVGFEPTRTLPP